MDKNEIDILSQVYGLKQEDVIMYHDIYDQMKRLTALVMQTLKPITDSKVLPQSTKDAIIILFLKCIIEQFDEKTQFVLNVLMLYEPGADEKRHLVDELMKKENRVKEWK